MRIHGALDRSKQARADLTTLNSVALDFTLSGPDSEQAAALVDAFKLR